MFQIQFERRQQSDNLSSGQIYKLNFYLLNLDFSDKQNRILSISVSNSDKTYSTICTRIECSSPISYQIQDICSTFFAVLAGYIFANSPNSRLTHSFCSIYVGFLLAPKLSYSNIRVKQSLIKPKFISIEWTIQMNTVVV